MCQWVDKHKHLGPTQNEHMIVDRHLYAQFFSVHVFKTDKRVIWWSRAEESGKKIRERSSSLGSISDLVEKQEHLLYNCCVTDWMFGCRVLTDTKKSNSQSKGDRCGGERARRFPIHFEIRFFEKPSKQNVRRNPQPEVQIPNPTRLLLARRVTTAQLEVIEPLEKLNQNLKNTTRLDTNPSACG